MQNKAIVANICIASIKLFEPIFKADTINRSSLSSHSRLFKSYFWFHIIVCFKYVFLLFLKTNIKWKKTKTTSRLAAVSARCCMASLRAVTSCSSWGWNNLTWSNIQTDINLLKYIIKKGGNLSIIYIFSYHYFS